MDRTEHKELDTIDIKKLTKFQKNQVISLVDRFIEDNKETSKGSFNVCPKCGKDHPRITKAGKTKGGKQMYLCHGCGRRFVEDIGRPSHSSWYDISAWRIFIEDTIQGKTLDESAEKLGIYHSTLWGWRHKIMDKLRSFQDDVVLSDKCELDEKYFRKSHKGKKMAGAKPKKRGTPAKKRGISGELICSLTGVSRDGAAFAEVHNMGKPSQDDVGNISRHFNSGTYFYIDGTNCYDRLVKEKEGGSKKLINWMDYDEYNHLNNVNSLHSRMEERYKRCHGVASKYLPRYCALWARVYSLSGQDLPDKVKSVLGLYVRKADDKRLKTSKLQTSNIFDMAAS